MRTERPPRKPGSKMWLGILIGCLGLGLLASVTLGVLAFRFATGVRSAMPSGPRVTPALVRIQFAGVPQYPGAALDLAMTQTTLEAMRAAMSLMPKGPYSSSLMGSSRWAMYHAPAVPADVLAWYDQQLRVRGWAGMGGRQPAPNPFAGQAVQEQRLYQKGAQMLAVTVSAAQGGRSQLALMLVAAPAKSAPPANGP